MKFCRVGIIPAPNHIVKDNMKLNPLWNINLVFDNAYAPVIATNIDTKVPYIVMKNVLQ